MLLRILTIFFLLALPRAETNYSFVEFIREVAEKSATSVLRIRHDHCPEEWLQELMWDSSRSVTLQSLNDTFTGQLSKALQVVCLPKGFTTSWLDHLSRRESTIFLLQDYSSEELLKLLKHCHHLKVHQVLALQVEDSRQFYSYRPLPHFEMEISSIQSLPDFIENRENRYPNMEGRPLIVMPDQGHPRSMVYVDSRSGKQIFGGSVGRFINLLACKLNATMKFAPAMKPGQTIHPNEVLRLLEEFPIDIPVTMNLATKPEHVVSFPYELTHICLMIPLAGDVPLGEIYRLLASVQNVFIALAIVYGFGVFLSFHQFLSQKIVCVVDFLLNDRALRGLLGQSFKLSPTDCKSLSIKGLYFTLSIIGLNLSCIYEAALGTMLTHPPKYFQPRTVADLQRVGLQMAIAEADIALSRAMDIPLYTVNGSEYNRLKSTLNTSHVYLCSRLHWTLFSQQQKYFARELFLYSMDACLSTLTLMSFPLSPDSWFIEPITRLNFDVRASGIYQYYVGMHFSDMVAARLVSFQDLSQGQRPEKRKGASLALEDLKWIWYAYVVLLLLAFIVFVIEIMWNKN